MTLKELISKYSFDELYPYLQKIEPEHLDCIYNFREAYDLLRHREIAEEEEEGEILIKHEDYTFVCGSGSVENPPLRSRIEVEYGLPFNEPDILAHILWEMTFFSFGVKSDDDDKQPFAAFSKSHNQYEEALERLQLSQWKRTTPRRYRSSYIPLCTHIERDIKRKDTANRSKRKRNYRVERREQYLKRHAQRERFICKLTREGSSFKREDVEYLHQVESGHYYPYISRTWDVNKRIHYILESISKYQEADFSPYNDAIAFLRTSSAYPVLDEEVHILSNALKRRLPNATLLTGTGIKESLGKDMELHLFLNKRD